MIPSNLTEWVLLVLGLVAGFYLVKHIGSGGSAV